MGLTYVDSCVIIDAMLNSEERGDIARNAIEGAQADTVCTSPLVELECLIRPFRIGDQQWIAATRGALGRFRSLEITARCYELAAHLRAIHGLKTADSLHLATASLGGCNQLWTNDSQLLAAMPGFATEPPAVN